MARADTAVERASRAARDALNQAVRDDVDSRRFRIDKFGRHRDGYLHARVIVDGATQVYFHLRYGSWLAPGGSGVLKEPEALLGPDLGRVVKFTLAETAHRFHRSTREEEPDGPEPKASDPGGTGQTVPDAGVPA